MNEPSNALAHLGSLGLSGRVSKLEGPSFRTFNVDFREKTKKFLVFIIVIRRRHGLW